MSVNKRFTLIAPALLMVAVSATAQNNAEQVTFGAQGVTMTLTNNTKNIPATPFGFWIWCSADAPSGSQGGYAAHHACQGSIYFYALGHTMAVIGDVSEDPNNGGIYTMSVLQGTLPELLSGTHVPAFTCTLTNKVPDAQGSINSAVDVNCVFISPELGGPSTGAALGIIAGVNVTGPK